jgi:iron complex transport system substrate-binding protein
MAAHPARITVAVLLASWAVASAQIDARPRIVSLVPALTEMLFAIGAGPQVLAVSSYDDYPEQVKTLPRVGALLDPDTERILSMKPDLVLTYGSQQDLRAQLQRAGIGTFDYRHGGLPDIMSTLRRLGRATGHADEAERVARDLEERLEAIRRRTAGRPKPRALLVFGREPLTLRNLYASGARGFLHDMLELAGGANVFNDVARESVVASTEMLLTRAPEVIVELHHTGHASPATAQRERDAWRPLGAIPAVKTGRIHLLFGDHLVVPGPRIAQAAEEIARALHPAAFQP